MRKIVFLALTFLLGTTHLFSQVQQTPSSTEIYHQLEKLNFLGTALYVAAHPDDENTGMISYLSNEVNARVGYISLTRGDGGQNLIGTEIRELLGVIRTEELMEARKIDGGHQFFSRANDFGYSKHPDETFEIWDKDIVLSDLVYVIRKFKPDVIINRFDHRSPGTTHGHHTASAILSLEAFDLANDKTKFPEHFDRTTTWQVKRVFFNTNWWFFGSQEKFDKADKSKYLQVDIGNYYPSLGLSNTEISAKSRSQHRSQGFGMEGKRGTDINFLEPVKGDFNVQHHSSIFAGIDTTWNRVEGGKSIGEILQKVQEDFDFKNPAQSLPELIKAYQLIKNLKDDHWRTIKLEEIEKIILACSGVYLQATTTEEFATRNAEVNVIVEAVNRSTANVYLNSVRINSNLAHLKVEDDLAFNKVLKQSLSFKVPENMPYSVPYWLNEESTLGMYQVNNPEFIALPNTPVNMVVTYQVVIEGEPFAFHQDLKYKSVTPDVGEVIKPFSIVPEASVGMDRKTLVFADLEPKEITVTVKAYKDNVVGELKLNAPKTWTITPTSIPVNLANKGMKESYTFTIQPKKKGTEDDLSPELIIGESFTKELHVIDYDHIDKQPVLLPAITKIIQLDIQKKGKNIGYIIGAGDEVAENLREIGYQVTEMLPTEIKLDKLMSFDAVVLGIRAYDIDNDLPVYQDVLFEYIKQGGTVVTQYNSLRELKTKTLAPYELQLSHDRVTDEHSPVRFLDKKHPILNSPNIITQKDFEGWVQERGLYFSNKWGKEFTPILGMHDKGEKELKGGLLVAQYGEGYFIYTGLSFFRELPAGVSGAYRLLANILSIGK